MKKKSFLIAVLAVVMAFIVAGCGAGSVSMFGVETNDDNTVTVTAKNGSKDSEGTANLTVGEGEEIVIDHVIEDKGQIQITFYDPGDHETAVTDYTAEGTEQGIIGLPAGDYDLSIKALTEVSGTVNISLRKIGEEEGSEKWNEAKSAKEAAKAAGLDTFEYGEGNAISLGDVKAEKTEYMEGVVHAYIPIAAVDLNIYKGLASIDEGDISFDQKKYEHEWTQNIKGLEVKCFGNREGEATKTIWTVDDYSYAITAYGAGGDDDFGLSADDISSLVNAIQ